MVSDELWCSWGGFFVCCLVKSTINCILNTSIKRAWQWETCLLYEIIKSVVTQATDIATWQANLHVDLIGRYNEAEMQVRAKLIVLRLFAEV
jgi:hypothetical protein